VDLNYDVVSLERQAQLACAMQVYDDAIVFHSRAVTIADQLEQSRLVAVLFDRLGDTLMANGDIADATTAYKAGVQSLSAPLNLNIESILVSFRAVGSAFYSFDTLHISDHYDSLVAETLNTALLDSTLPARLLVNCADGYAHQAYYGLALQVYKQALAQLGEIKGLELRTHVLARLGMIAFRCGETDTVDETLRELLELQTQRTDPQAQCCILTALGNIYETCGEIKGALTTYRQGVQISLGTNDPVTVGNVRGHLVRLSLQQRGRSKKLRHAQQESVTYEEAEADVLNQAVAHELIRSGKYELG